MQQLLEPYYSTKYIRAVKVHLENQNLPQWMVRIYISQLRYPNPLERGIFWNECEICGFRSKSLEHHIHKTKQTNILPNHIEIHCKNCGKTEQIFDAGFRHRWRIQNFDLCSTCLKTCTMIERYGYKTNFSNKENRIKIQNTIINRYGGLGYGSHIIRTKIEKTNLERYGTECVLSNCNIHQKTKETQISRYGGIGFHDKLRQDIAKKTNLERYGVECVFSLNKNKKKFRDILKLRYGISGPLGTPEVRKKIEKTNLERYGYISPLSNSEVRKRYIAAGKKMSRPEQLVKEMLINRQIPFVHQFAYNNHLFDFAILNQNNEPILLVDVDGLFWHGIISEPNESSRPDTTFYDINRVHKCASIPFVCIYEGKEEEGFKTILATIGQNYDQYIDSLFVWCRTFNPFPFPYYEDSVLKKSWTTLVNSSGKLGQAGLKLVKHFHHSIQYCHKDGYLSPVEAFNDDNLLMKCIKNRFIYKTDLCPERIADGFTIAKIAPRISLFKPTLAKYLINKYLNQYQTIFDPFSGYSGRMLGAISLGKQYIGQDINETTISESLALADFLHIYPDLQTKDILESSGTYDCLFTCPPYSSKEIYGTEKVFKSCDEWIDECLSRFKCKSYLFVVDNTKKYKDFVVDTITNKSHLNTNTEFVIYIKNC